MIDLGELVKLWLEIRALARKVSKAMKKFLIILGLVVLVPTVLLIQHLSAEWDAAMHAAVMTGAQ